MNRYFFLYILLGFTGFLVAQTATVAEETKSLKTYMYSDPDPVPILVSNPKIYPYYKYEGFEEDSEMRDWKVVKLENDFIEVYVLPEVGGKVWGAIDKTTGKEFIYRNEVMKFRDISMRGPWTSGGIEFNFGIIGHHPSTATPVDYLTQTHEDGSVSCTVGNIDLSSRTQWRVKISLHPGEAFFRTKATWYNPTDVHQAYYNWMTAAAFAQEDLVFYTPGDQYLKHSGEAVSWPEDIQGRDLSKYNENNFGPSKSYHVVGEYNDFFGGYFEKEDYGFGHLSSYEEMPGQKLWLWALSRSGGIWEDLLTDGDGQYIEFQAGRLFVQYAPGGHTNPVTQATFEPMSTDIWEETWFPVNEIGGITDASDLGVMHISHIGNKLDIEIMGLQDVQGDIMVKVDDTEVLSKNVSLQPLSLWNESIQAAADQHIQIITNGLDIQYDNNPELLSIKRPFDSPKGLDQNTHSYIYRAAIEDVKFREFEQARMKFDKILSNEPYHLDALIGLGDLEYRAGKLEEALELGLKALSLDTYHSNANFLCGNIHRGIGDLVNALECYGWAARSMTYRSAAYAKMAEIYIVQKNWTLARNYVAKSLNNNAQNISALQSQLILGRKLEDMDLIESAFNKLLTLDPLNHFAHAEINEAGGSENGNTMHNRHRSEEPIQTYLELAMIYVKYGMNDHALQILEKAPSNWLVELWKDHLDNGKLDQLTKVQKMATGTLFPYRKESLKLLNSASRISDNWKVAYWYGLALQGKGRNEEAAAQFAQCGDRPDDPAFYLTRASLFGTGLEKGKDLRTAYNLDKSNWRSAHSLVNHYLDENRPDDARAVSAASYKIHPDNYVVGMDHIKVLFALEQYENAEPLLDKIKVLPFEGASAGKIMYASIKRNLALKALKENQLNKALGKVKEAKQWPENLGVGKPFDPDERIDDFLEGLILEKQGNTKEAKLAYQNVMDRTDLEIGRTSQGNILGLFLLVKNGKQDKAHSLYLLAEQLGQNNSEYLSKLNQVFDQSDLTGLKLIQELIGGNSL